MTTKRKTPAKASAGRVRFDLATTPGHLMRRAQQYSFDLFSEEVGTVGLTPRQFAVLVAIEQDEGLSQTDLVRATGIDRSTLADMISRMLDKKLIARQRTKSDQRANSVGITAAGRRALRAALPKVKKAEARLLAPIPRSKRADFMKNLRLIASAIQDDATPTETRKPPRKAKAARPKARKSSARKRKAPRR